MCGRFTRSYTRAQIKQLYELADPAAPTNLAPRYNICPTTDIDVVVLEGSERHVVPMRWGLIPAWWKKTIKELPATFNARAETVADKPMFRDAFHRKRCLIPASGYYEWLNTEDGKQPFYFTRQDGEVMTIAGLYAEWREPLNRSVLESATMVVGGANEFVGQFHDRMPVVLEKDEFAAWERGDVRLAENLLRAKRPNVLQAWPVSRRVNSSKADEFDETLIAKVYYAPLAPEEPRLQL
jgi:putative SOS response-associated peptidase YedK